MDKLIPLGVWGIGNDHIKIGGVKYFTDGSIQGFTGALLEDYPYPPRLQGLAAVARRKRSTKPIIKYHCSLSVAVHTNGDAASDRPSKLLKRPWSGALVRICAICSSMRSSFPTRSLSA